MEENKRAENLRLSNEESNKFTCDCLKTALLRLVARKPYETISISELVKESGVSRNSFYRNYGSMDSLLNALRDEIITKISEFIKSRESCTDRKEWFLELFSTVREKQEEFHILLGIKMPLNFFAEGIDFSNLLPVNISELTYENLSEAGAFLMILFHWFTSGMKESPEEMAEVCDRILK